MGKWTIKFFYGADTDNIQDSLWFTEAYNSKDSNTVYLIVGGDDNSFVFYYQGRRYEVECDVSGCDQSHHAHFAHIFEMFLKLADVNPDIIKQILETYTADGKYYHRNELVATLRFMCSQLKTGVGHTSLANTIVVACLMIYILSHLLPNLS